MNAKRRTRSRQRTSADLKDAMERLQSAGKRLSIAGVAYEAGFDPSLIHHSYKDIAAEIRAASGMRVRGSKSYVEEVKLLRDRNRELRADRSVLLGKLAEAASVVMTLESELKLLKASAAGNLRRLENTATP